MVRNGDMRFLLLELILADQMASTVRARIARSPGRHIPHRGANNGTLRFLLLELILADQVTPADHLAPADHIILHLQIYPP